MRASLARVTAREPLHLQVGYDAVEVTTMQGGAVERRVPLPERWIKGFSEVQLAVADLAPALELDAVTAQRFLRSLPRGNAGRATLWAKAGPGGVRLAARAGGGAVCVAAPDRLRVLEPTARHLTGLRAYAQPDREAASVWVAELHGARLLVTSARTSRAGSPARAACSPTPSTRRLRSRPSSSTAPCTGAGASPTPT